VFGGNAWIVMIPENDQVRIVTAGIYKVIVNFKENLVLFIIVIPAISFGIYFAAILDAVHYSVSTIITFSILVLLTVMRLEL
jgi:hypothetical protein